MEKILIVDDQESIRRIYAELLSAEGYRCLSAPTASAANEILKKNRIDLVLLDLRMPEVNGSILYEVMKLFHKRVKVIVSSVYHMEKQKRMIPGADDYFDKSEGIEVLIKKIREVLASGVQISHLVCACPASGC